MNNNLYGSLNKHQLHIDKTSSLEKGIVVFPSIYIEGAAASGKTTAVKMLLAKHPEVKHTVIFMDRQDNNLESELSAIQKKMQKETIWLIFENVNHSLTKEECSIMKNFVRCMPEKGKVIFIGRERPHEELLDLMWKREMELIFQESLLFTKSEVREYLERSNSALKYDQVYEVTGGWPGCVDMMVRYPGKNADAKEVRESFEISTYIEKEIIGSLNEEERQLVYAGRNCPWLATELCQDMWQMKGIADTFERLKRKGIFYYNKIKKHYKLARLFQNGKDFDFTESWANLANWYEEHGNIREAFFCLKKTGEKDIYQEFLLRHYNVIPFLDVNYEDVLGWKQERLEIYYLRGMYHYSHQHFDNLKMEIEWIKQWTP